MYILIKYSSYYRGRKTFAYEDFRELKQDVIEKLNNRGWHDKSSVDLRSLKSCLYYMTNDFFNVDYKLSKSCKKFMQYRFGDKAMVI